MNNMQWPDLLFNLSISFVGGLIKAFISKIKKKSLSYFFISALVGGFAGLLTYMLCSSFNMSWQMTSFATGVAGYMGDTILQLFSEILPKFLSGKFNIQITDNSKENDKNNSKSDKK